MEPTDLFTCVQMRISVWGQIENGFGLETSQPSVRLPVGEWKLHVAVLFLCSELPLEPLVRGRHPMQFHRGVSSTAQNPSFPGNQAMLAGQSYAPEVKESSPIPSTPSAYLSAPGIGQYFFASGKMHQNTKHGLVFFLTNPISRRYLWYYSSNKAKSELSESNGSKSLAHRKNVGS